MIFGVSTFPSILKLVAWGYNWMISSTNVWWTIHDYLLMFEIDWSVSLNVKEGYLS